MTAEPRSASAVGQGRFRRMRELGRGATAVVDLVFDEVRGEPVALKRMRQLNAESRFRLKEEFRRVQDVRHPSLAKLYDLFVEEGDTFFTMEPIFGQELGHAITDPAFASDAQDSGQLSL